MKQNTTAVFVGGMRTPFSKAGKGAFKDIRPDDLLSGLWKEQVKNLPNRGVGALEEAVVGCAYPEGEQGYNVARMAALGAGLPIPALTVNRLCGSSLDAAAIVAAKIVSGQISCGLVGGVESMSRVPRRGANFSASEEITKAWPQAYITMGDTAEEICKRYPISRSQQEEYTCRSHELAQMAYSKGYYQGQVIPMGITQDDMIRYPMDRQKMTQLPPAFREDGMVTAATSSPLTDGATSGLITTPTLAREWGYTCGLEFLNTSWSHVEPEVMGLGPVPAIRKLLAQSGEKLGNIAALEMNEAFAVQVLACMQDLQIPLETLNAWGGALSMGHPLGASGLRLLMTLHKRLEHIGTRNTLGIASLCVGGGQGVAMLVRYVEF
jgi:acetyl-CoA acyltransferase